MLALINVWLEATGVILLAGAGVLLARFSATLPGRWWIAGYLVGLGVIGLIGLAYWERHLQFWPPFS